MKRVPTAADVRAVDWVRDILAVEIEALRELFDPKVLALADDARQQQHLLGHTVTRQNANRGYLEHVREDAELAGALIELAVVRECSSPQFDIRVRQRLVERHYHQRHPIGCRQRLATVDLELDPKRRCGAGRPFELGGHLIRHFRYESPSILDVRLRPSDLVAGGSSCHVRRVRHCDAVEGEYKVRLVGVAGSLPEQESNIHSCGTRKAPVEDDVAGD
mmetsp:Transcript_16096/g.27753  ORF Transcript_16096/g.27753 Transcript_16096/m.27753 type:complete len:219 (-) Transcript_16096:72-728(-)